MYDICIMKQIFIFILLVAVMGCGKEGYDKEYLEFKDWNAYDNAVRNGASKIYSMADYIADGGTGLTKEVMREGEMYEEYIIQDEREMRILNPDGIVKVSGVIYKIGEGRGVLKDKLITGDWKEFDKELETRASNITVFSTDFLWRANSGANAKVKVNFHFYIDRGWSNGYVPKIKFTAYERGFLGSWKLANFNAGPVCVGTSGIVGRTAVGQNLVITSSGGTISYSGADNAESIGCWFLNQITTDVWPGVPYAYPLPNTFNSIHGTFYLGAIIDGVLGYNYPSSSQNTTVNF